MKLKVTQVNRGPLQHNGTWVNGVVFESEDGVTGSMALPSHGDVKVDEGDEIELTIIKPAPLEQTEQTEQTDGGGYDQG